MTFALKLTHDEPRLVYLALVYHLGRPGSELDAETRQVGAHGLHAVKIALGAHLEDESAIIELDEAQYRRLLSAIYGSVNELRVYHMRGGGDGDVPRFGETVRALFPAAGADPESALDVAEAMMMLHRRIERAVGRAVATPPAGAPPMPKRRRWPFRR